MRRTALRVLVCPVCRAPFEAHPVSQLEIRNGTLSCTSGGHTFQVAEGIPLLVREDDSERTREFVDSYTVAWRRDGWGSDHPSHLLQLPFRDLSGRQREKWRVKARSMEALLRELERISSARVADLGAGVAWLSYHLAQQGWEAYAVDISLDPLLGLRAAEAYLATGVYFERVQAEFDHLPFPSDCLDLAIFNASIQYAESLEKTLTEAGRVLRSGGHLVIIGSPMHSYRQSAARAEADFRTRLRSLGANDLVANSYHHHTEKEMLGLMEDLIGPAYRIKYDPGPWFRVKRRVKGIVLGMELASFPLFISQKS